ncbi:FUSC family protein [Rhodobacterales bacterium]|nr:FUSC family protein [Rhodobacterales bacterium]
MNECRQTEPSHGALETARRRDMARVLLHHHRIEECLSLSAQPWLRNSVLAGVQAAFSSSLILPVIYYLSPWPHLAGFAALGALMALFGRFAPRARTRRRIVLACGLTQVAGVFLMSATGVAGFPDWSRLLLLAGLSGVFFLVSLKGRFGPPGALLFIFAAGAAMAPIEGLQMLLERSLATAAGAFLAWLICAATEPLRHTSNSGVPFPPDTLPPLDERLKAAGRIVLGTALAGFAVVWAGAGHPTWAMMGTVVVLQGVNLHTNVTRAFQRMAGTLVGAAVVWLLLAQQPPFWSVILIVAILQIATEFVIGANYALGQILVTPMALLMTYLAAHGQVSASMAPERMFDTIVGAMVGIAIAVLFSSETDRLHLARHHAAKAKA